MLKTNITASTPALIAMGQRIRAARDQAGLNQEQLSDQLGFSDRQTLSSIENGSRRIQAGELSKLGKIFEKPVEWFLDPFVIAGEAKFSWRVSPSVTEECLHQFESSAGEIIGLLRFLMKSLQGNPKTLTPMLRIDEYSKFEDAWEWGEALARELDLGLIPTDNLIEGIEKKLNFPIVFIDPKEKYGIEGISGAMCRLRDLGVIFVNRQESFHRRFFDISHELFHALTWDFFQPSYRDLEVSSIKTKGKEKRIESLADNFAAGLLMPRNSLKELIDPAYYSDAQHLAEVSQKLHVSSKSLGYRLLNLKLIDQKTFNRLIEVKLPKPYSEPVKLLSENYANLLHDGIALGHVSSRKAAKALSMNLQELHDVLTSYGKSVPFSI